MNLLMREGKKEVPNIIVNGYIEKAATEFMIDSGASKNFKYSNFAKSLNVSFEEDEDITITFGNNESIKTNHSKTLPITIGETKIPFNVKFYALDSCPMKFILGNEFLANTNAIINYRNGTVIIENEILNFANESPKEMAELDKILVDSVCVTIENISCEELQQEVYDYHRQNESFGCMAIEPVRLKMSKDIKPPKPKYYAVPQKLVSQTKDEIERLLTEDIIEKARLNYVSPAGVAKL